MTTPSSDERFQVNGPNVVHQTIEGEAIVLNLGKGDYYSLLAAGAGIWNGLARGASRGEIIEETAGLYEADRETIAKAVDALIGELLKEGLIAPAEAKSAARPAPKAGSSAAKAPFTAPSLQKYTDMEDMLLLDPIHEVDATGWPNARTAEKK